jgi:hypothetical protein
LSRAHRKLAEYWELPLAIDPNSGRRSPGSAVTCVRGRSRSQGRRASKVSAKCNACNGNGPRSHTKHTRPDTGVGRTTPVWEMLSAKHAKHVPVWEKLSAKHAKRWLCLWGLASGALGSRLPTALQVLQVRAGHWCRSDHACAWEMLSAKHARHAAARAPPRAETA